MNEKCESSHGSDPAMWTGQDLLAVCGKQDVEANPYLQPALKSCVNFLNRLRPGQERPMSLLVPPIPVPRNRKVLIDDSA